MTSLRTYDIGDFGAIGDSLADDTPALSAALNSARLFNGTVIIPPGRFLVDPVFLINVSSKIAIHGAGPNVSLLVSRNGGTLRNLSFLQQRLTQPFLLTIDGYGFAPVRQCDPPHII